MAAGSVLRNANSRELPLGSPLLLRLALNRIPTYDGQFFDITQPNGPPFEGAVTLMVPAGIALTDAHVTFSVPENVPNARLPTSAPALSRVSIGEKGSHFHRLDGSHSAGKFVFGHTKARA